MWGMDCQILSLIGLGDQTPTIFLSGFGIDEYKKIAIAGEKIRNVRSLRKLYA
jgi:hypothetical protein